MINVTLVGFGNVGFHLATAFQTADDVHLKQIYNRTAVEVSVRDHFKTDFITDLDLLQKADVYIIAVKDDFIDKMVACIPFQKAVVAHTSGSVQLLQTHHQNAVFYPLQTFSKAKKINYKKIPFCLEAEDKETYAIIEKLAKSISTKVYQINTLQRQQLHLSAVFVCNFVNHLYAIGEEICTQNQIPFEILETLIEETAEKIKTLAPNDAQTGPALRNDQKTINRHLIQLQNTNYKKLYQQLTNSIILKHGKKL